MQARQILPRHSQRQDESKGDFPQVALYIQHFSLVVAREARCHLLPDEFPDTLARLAPDASPDINHLPQSVHLDACVMAKHDANEISG